MLAVARLLELLVYVFMFSIVALVILSWIQPQSYNPVFGLLNSLYYRRQRLAKAETILHCSDYFFPVENFFTISDVLSDCSIE